MVNKPFINFSHFRRVLVSPSNLLYVRPISFHHLPCKNHQPPFWGCWGSQRNCPMCIICAPEVKHRYLIWPYLKRDRFSKPSFLGIYIKIWGCMCFFGVPLSHVDVPRFLHYYYFHHNHSTSCLYVCLCIFKCFNQFTYIFTFHFSTHDLFMQTHRTILEYPCFTFTSVSTFFPSCFLPVAIKMIFKFKLRNRTNWTLVIVNRRILPINTFYVVYPKHHPWKVCLSAIYHDAITAAYQK